MHRLNPFLGTFEGMTAFGQFETVGRCVAARNLAGWYVEFFFHFEWNGLVRENRISVTFDEAAGSYVCVRLPSAPYAGCLGAGRFDGEDLVLEVDLTTASGGRQVVQNVVRLDGQDMEFVTNLLEDGVSTRAGITRMKRVG